MRWIAITFMILGFDATLMAAEAPLVEKYLHSGQLARGEQVLETALVASPADDQLRFGLAVLQLVRGVERLGQSLHQYGCKPDVNSLFLRIPVPKNPDPSPISAADYRRMLDAFRSDLGTVESTLAAIKSRDVTLPLRLAEVRLNMTGQEGASEKFLEILKKLMGAGFRPLADNPEFLIRFDRGDVAWLRAYCHLLMGIIDFSLAFDIEREFPVWFGPQFAKPIYRKGLIEELGDNWITDTLKIVEPARMGHFRRHIVKVCELNRETWAFIRDETDDDHEWLPNVRQRGVLGIPVSNLMIDAWLGAVAEIQDLFEGKKVIPASLLQIVSPPTTKPFNVKAFFEDPPDDISSDRVRQNGIREKYLDDTRPNTNIDVFIRIFSILQNPLGVGYAAWFN